MKVLWRSAALVASLMLTAAQCTTSTSTANNSPEVSSSATASSSPSASPSSSPIVSPSTAASPSTSTLTFASAPLHNGEVGVIYLAVQLGASGGAPPYSWSISGGTFAPGLNLSTGGLVTGNNTASGNFSFTIRVTDSAAATAERSISMHVFSALTVSAPCANSCGVEEGCTACGAFGSVSGGLTPYHYTILSDNRPTGMGLTGLTLTGTFPPPPVNGGNFSLKMQVADDQFGATRTIVANWSIFPHITITPTTYTCGFSADNCTLGVSYSGGTPGGTPSIMVVSVGTAFNGGVPQGPPRMTLPGGTGGCQTPTQVTPTGLPLMTVVSVSAGVVSIAMAGQFSGNTQMCTYTARVTIALVDQSPCGTPTYCTSNTATIDIGI